MLGGEIKNHRQHGVAIRRSNDEDVNGAINQTHVLPARIRIICWLELPQWFKHHRKVGFNLLL